MNIKITARALYTDTFVPLTEISIGVKTRALWVLDEISTSKVEDTSGQGHEGTLTTLSNTTNTSTSAPLGKWTNVAMDMIKLDLSSSMNKSFAGDLKALVMTNTTLDMSKLNLTYDEQIMFDETSLCSLALAQDNNVPEIKIKDHYLEAVIYPTKINYTSELITFEASSTDIEEAADIQTAVHAISNVSIWMDAFEATTYVDQTLNGNQTNLPPLSTAIVGLPVVVSKRKEAVHMVDIVLTVSIENSTELSTMFEENSIEAQNIVDDYLKSQHAFPSSCIGDSAVVCTTSDVQVSLFAVGSRRIHTRKFKEWRFNASTQEQVPVYDTVEKEVKGTFVTLKAVASFDNESIASAARENFKKEHGHPGLVSTTVTLTKNNFTLATYVRMNTPGKYENIAEERLKNPVKEQILPSFVDKDVVYKALYNKTCGDASNATMQNLCKLAPTDVAIWNSQNDSCTSASHQRCSECSGGVNIEVLAPNDWLAENINATLKEWSEDSEQMMRDLDLHQKEMRIEIGNLTVEPKESVSYILEWEIKPKTMDVEEQLIFKKTLQQLFLDECMEVGSCSTGFDNVIEQELDDSRKTSNADSSEVRQKTLMTVRATTEPAQVRAENLMSKLKVLLPLYDIQSDTSPEPISVLPSTVVQEMTWGRHGDNTTLQKTGEFHVQCNVEMRSSDMYKPECRMTYRVHREVVEDEWVSDVWRDVGAGMVLVKEKTGWESQITYGACILGLLEKADPRCDLAFSPGVYRLEVKSFRVDDPDFVEKPSTIFQWRIQESLPPPIVYISPEKSIPQCEHWKMNGFMYVCTTRIQMRNISLLMNVDQDDTSMMYRSYFPGKKVNCIGGSPVETPLSINKFGIGKLYNGIVDIDCHNSLVNCVDDANTKISKVDADGKLMSTTTSQSINAKENEINLQSLNRTALIQNYIDSGLDISFTHTAASVESMNARANTLRMEGIEGLGIGSVVVTGSTTDTSGLFKNHKYLVADIDMSTNNVLLSHAEGPEAGKIVDLTYRPQSTTSCIAFDPKTNVLQLNFLDDKGFDIDLQVGDIVETNKEIQSEIIGLAASSKYKIRTVASGNKVTLAAVSSSIQELATAPAMNLQLPLASQKVNSTTLTFAFSSLNKTSLKRFEQGSLGTETSLSWNYPVKLITSVLVVSDESSNRLTLDTVEGLDIGSMVVTGSTTDTSGLFKNQKYFVKTLDFDEENNQAAALQLSTVEGGAAVDLTYKPPVITKLVVTNSSTNTLTITSIVATSTTDDDEGAATATGMTPGSTSGTMNPPYNVNDKVVTSHSVDVSGLTPSTLYKIKTLVKQQEELASESAASFKVTLVPGDTLDSLVATTPAVELTYVPSTGSQGTTKTTFIKSQLTLKIPFASPPNNVTDVITLDGTTALVVGDVIIYSKNSDLVIGGLTDGMSYFVSTVTTTTTSITSTQSAVTLAVGSDLISAAPVNITAAITTLGDATTQPLTTTFVRSSVLGVLQYADHTANVIYLNDISGLRINDVLRSSPEADLSGIEQNKNYKIKVLDGYSMTLVPGDTADSLVASTDSIKLTYVPSTGSQGTSLTLLTKASTGSLGTNATTLHWNVTLNLTLSDDQQNGGDENIVPMDGDYMVDLFAENVETSFKTNDEEIVTLVWEVDNTVPDLRFICGSMNDDHSQCNRQFPYVVSANINGTIENDVVVSVFIRNDRDADALPSMEATHTMQFLNGSRTSSDIDIAKVCSESLAQQNNDKNLYSHSVKCEAMCWFETKSGQTVSTTNLTWNETKRSLNLPLSISECPEASWDWKVGWIMTFPQISLPGEDEYRSFAQSLQRNTPIMYKEEMKLRDLASALQELRPEMEVPEQRVQRIMDTTRRRSIRVRVVDDAGNQNQVEKTWMQSPGSMPPPARRPSYIGPTAETPQRVDGVFMEVLKDSDTDFTLTWRPPTDRRVTSYGVPIACKPIQLNTADEFSGHEDDYGDRCDQIREMFRSTHYLVWWVASNSILASQIVEMIGRTALVDGYRGEPTYMMYALAAAQKGALEKNGVSGGSQVWYIENATCPNFNISNSTAKCNENPALFGIPVISALVPTQRSERGPYEKEMIPSKDWTWNNDQNMWYQGTTQVAHSPLYLNVKQNITRIVDTKIKFGVALVPKLWESEVKTCLNDSNAENPCQVYEKPGNRVPISEFHTDVWVTTHDCATNEFEFTGQYLHRRHYKNCEDDCERGEMKTCEKGLGGCYSVAEVCPDCEQGDNFCACRHRASKEHDPNSFGHLVMQQDGTEICNISNVSKQWDGDNREIQMYEPRNDVQVDETKNWHCRECPKGELFFLCVELYLNFTLLLVPGKSTTRRHHLFL